MNTLQKERLQELESGVFHFLTGYLGANPSRAKEIMDYPNWQERARLEMERRITQILGTFDDDTILALAEGTIDMKDIAARVLTQEAASKG